MVLRKISRPWVLAAIAVAPVATAAHGQTTGAPGTSETGAQIEELIVTAQKRSENIQKVPIAVSAFSGDTLKERGITDTQALVRAIPNLNFADNYNQARISVRGLGYDNVATQAGEPRVAFYVDGGYIALPADIGGTFYDIQRIEVSRGPQGTLYGRNAVAGAANLITNDPSTTFGGYLNVEAGTYATANADGAITGRITDGVSARFAFQTRNHSGYDFNSRANTDLNDQHTQAARLKLKFDKGGNYNATLTADYFHERDHQGDLFVRTETGLTPLAVVLGGVVGDSNPRHSYDAEPVTFKETFGFNLDQNLDLGHDYTLTSITAFRRSHFDYQFGNPIPPTIVTPLDPLILSSYKEHATQFSEELRVQKDFTRGNFVVGVYLYDQNYRSYAPNPVNYLLGQFIFGPPPAGPAGGYVQGFTQAGHQKTQSVAGFGQFTYKFTDTTSLIFGARYGWERKEKSKEFLDVNFSDPFDPNFFPPGAGASGKVTYTNFSPRVTIDQQLGPDQSIYVTFAKGFKAGGFNLGTVAPPYLQENLTDYEAGFKGQFFDRRLRFNAAAFYYEYSNLQVTVALPTVSEVENAAAAKLYGAEFEITAIPVEGLEINVAPAWLHSEFTKFDTLFPADPSLGILNLSGNRLPNTPNYTISYGVQYTFDALGGKMTVRGDGRSISNLYFDQFNKKTNSTPANTQLNASLGWRDNDNRLSITAYVKNITDSLYLNGTFNHGALLGSPLNGTYDPPRTFTVRVGYNF